ncbi:MAG: hypothetical protein AAB655_01555 [Patescibacteria group bacterium]
MTITPEKRSGYIALVAALIISAALIAIVMATGQVSYLERADVSNSHFKSSSRALADACAEVALLNLGSSSSYSGNETVAVGSSTCSVLPLSSGENGARVISVYGKYQNSYTNLKITVPSSSVSVLSWEEVKSF